MTPVANPVGAAMTNSKQSLSVEERDVVTARMGANVERGNVVLWLRMVAKARDDRADPEWAAALFEAADFIERGEHMTALRSRSPLEDNSSHDQQ